MTASIDVHAEAVSLERGGRTILQEVSVAVPAGTLAALVGPSGSGKTTLLTILATVETPDHGTVRYGDHTVDPSSRGPWTGRAQIAHQSFGLLSLLTASENVELALQALPPRRRPPRQELRAAAHDALDRLGLAARADHLVEELSGGEQQRTALARAIVTRPELLFADEPTAQLDPDNRARVTELLLHLSRAGATVIVATHDAELAARCDLVFTLFDGLIRPPC